MKPLRYGLRLSGLVTHVIIGVVLTALMAGVLRQSHNQPFYRLLIRWWLGGIPRLLGIQVRVHGQPSSESTLLVANHVSWLDITVVGGAANPRFLSKQEVRHWPVIGWLAEKSGTLFITRGKAGAAAQASASIQQALQQGRPVLLFPEGTTTAGNDVKTFHGRLLAPAIDGNVPIQPVAIRYPNCDGQTHPLIPYINEQSLWENLKGILGETGLQAEVHFLPPIPIAGQERKVLAAHCEAQIRAVVNPDTA
jgi:1-acyl-sn-glycerol-3-phosphate acyltransferase